MPRPLTQSPPVSIRFDLDVYAYLIERANAAGVTLSAHIRAAVTKAAKAQMTLGPEPEPLPRGER